MSKSYYPMAFTEDVLDRQSHFGSRQAWDRATRHQMGSGAAGDGPLPADPLTDDEREFLAGLDGFFLASMSRTGWPYVQLRGGPTGFIQTPDVHTIAWADFRGNRQYISAGNLRHDDRVAMFFIDHPRQLRLKVYGRARVSDADNSSALAQPLERDGYVAHVEREVRVTVAAYDWNCAQHITPRYTADELAPTMTRLVEEISSLKAENARLRRGDDLREDF